MKTKVITTQDKMMNRIANQHQSAQLREVLNSMFPISYLELHHMPPRSVCSLLSLKRWPPPSQDPKDIRPDSDSEQHHQKLEVSTEPSSRVSLINLRERLDSSLHLHQAKLVGICPIRRNIYDQCFDEIIRQVTVSCIEQGLLLFRVRDELRMTISYYRRICESGVKFGLSKAIKAETEVRQVRSQIKRLESLKEDIEHNRRLDDQIDKLKSRNLEDSMERMRSYYKEELDKRDKIIEQQRNIIKALSRDCSVGIKSPPDSIMGKQDDI